MLYDAGVFESKKFTIPVVSIGNLAIGGAGKSPMAEYIIRLLKNQYKIAILSRGYKRKSKGFRLVDTADKVDQCGDEPLQFRRKFTNITVAVAEKRVEGIKILQKDHEIIILDDAYQHRAVYAGLNILLFDFTRLDDFLLILPAGNLREPFINRKRADLMVVSKCPDNLSKEQKELILQRLKPYPHQEVYFSYLEYGNLKKVNSDKELPLSKLATNTIYLLTGIANPTPLINKLNTYTNNLIHHNYPDHHTFSTNNISKLADQFIADKSENKIIITTEKDVQRLQLPALMELLNKLPVYYLPIMARIIQPDEQKFNDLIQNYASKHI
jgi:tetraacyldisaccharide 4'-kinase